MDRPFPRLLLSTDHQVMLTPQGQLKDFTLFQSLSSHSLSCLPSQYRKDKALDAKSALFENYLYCSSQDTFYHLEIGLKQKCSMFVGQELVKDAQILALYKSDPLFLILPYLTSIAPKKMEWKQIIADTHPKTQDILLQSSEIKRVLSQICHCKEAFDSHFYSLNKEKFMSIIETKIAKLQEEVRKDKYFKEQEINKQDALHLSLQLICEKLPRNLGEEVCQHFGKEDIGYVSLFEKKKEEEEVIGFTEEVKEEEKESLIRVKENSPQNAKKKQVKEIKNQGKIHFFYPPK